MKRGIESATLFERHRIDLLQRKVGCIVCWNRFSVWVPSERHHILRGGHAMGELYVIPLCPGHHRGVWNSAEERSVRGGVALSDGRPLFVKAYGSERSLWERCNTLVGLQCAWPDEKVPSRKGE